ncbi:MAG TPA: YifB family Mg chelatase-like AAA ATPase [Rectinemataceae bacterium]|nr:YifB family Mg chelatase-like AAA ATPase [Rectinemataceae bacterium]
MTVIAHEPAGFEGRLVTIEVDIRRGIPSVDLVGLAAGAVREARDRVRAAVRNSGFQFPVDRVLINLAPSDFPKEGSSYDLPMALAVLGAAGSVPDPGVPVLALGELRLDGSVRPVRGVLPAVAAGLASGVGGFIVPEDNLAEARALGRGSIHPIGRLTEAVEILSRLRAGEEPLPRDRLEAVAQGRRPGGTADLAELRGQALLRRALEIAAAGGHNVFLFGPPGSGKTMAARRFAGLLPDLGEDEAIEVATVYSLGGLLDAAAGLERRPPFRAPHHSASTEGMIGGGYALRPGEISLAHRGVLFLDEAAEFRSDVLQSLREPLEEGRVSIVRARWATSYPADFQLILAANPCPCGNLGRKNAACLCSAADLARYRRRLGGPLLDRIDIRVPVEPTLPAQLIGPPGESTGVVRARVEAAIAVQAARYRDLGVSRNARLRPDQVERFCPLSGAAAVVFERAVEMLGLSSRACHSILKTARTIADLEGRASISEAHLLEAVQHRRYGDGESPWPGA